MSGDDAGRRGHAVATLRYFADRARHLVCVPYTPDNLLAMAADLGIKAHWYHRGQHPHIDLPKRDAERVLADPRVTVVTTREVLAICRGGS